MKAILLSHVTASLKIVASFEEAGIELDIINTDTDAKFDYIPDFPKKVPIIVNLYNDIWIPNLKILRFFFVLPIVAKALKGFFSKNLSKLSQSKPDIIFGNWGTGVIPEINLLRSTYNFHGIPTILNLETFPTSWNSKFRERFELYILRKSLSKIDGFIVPTQQMLNYILNHIPEFKKKVVFQKPYYFPKKYYCDKNLESTPKKDLIFVGVPDYSRSLNDVRSQILDIASKDIEIYCSDKGGLIDKNIFQYNSFNASFLTSGGLFEYINTFKAALVVYNYSNEYKNPTRYTTSLPHRFLLPLSMGIPVVLPKGKFIAMEELIEKEGVGFAYSNPAELKDFLSTDKWAIAKEKLRVNQEKFVFQSNDFINFLNSVLTNNTKGTV